MIHEIDETLKEVLRQGSLRDTTVDVAFDAPTKDWAARRNTPTVNAYLYDIREDTARRERGPYQVRDERGLVSHRTQPYRWFRLSYLVTAWTKQPQDEHRLLSAVLATLLPREALAPGEFSGPLAELGLTVPVTIAVPPPESRSLADIWSALGGELKPSLDLVVTAPFPVTPRYAVAPPVKEVAVRTRSMDGSLEGSPERYYPRRTRAGAAAAVPAGPVKPAETITGQGGRGRRDEGRGRGRAPR